MYENRTEIALDDNNDAPMMKFQFFYSNDKRARDLFSVLFLLRNDHTFSLSKAERLYVKIMAREKRENVKGLGSRGGRFGGGEQGL